MPYCNIAPHGMSAGEKGLMIAIPLFGSAFFRILFGFMSDKFGSKNVGIMSLVLTMIPLTWGSLYANTYSQMLMVGALHYFVWGRAFSEEVAAEREALRRQDELDARPKPKPPPDAIQDISRTQGIQK